MYLLLYCLLPYVVANHFFWSGPSPGPTNPRKRTEPARGANRTETTTNDRKQTRTNYHELPRTMSKAHLALMPLEKDMKNIPHYYESHKGQWKGNPLVHTPIRFIVKEPKDRPWEYNSSDPWHYPQCAYRALANGATAYYYYDTEPRTWECAFYCHVETPNGFCGGKRWW